jgi:polysaccharide export outer membrane protein
MSISMRLISGFFIIAVAVLSSCVSNKQYTYLQKNDVNVDNLKKDTVVRTYENAAFEYKVQPNDLLHVQFESLTPSEYNFLTKSSDGGTNLNMNISNALLFGQLVDENGEIPFPILGKVRVAGLSIFKVQDTLQSIADQYLESPVVKVRLLNFRFTVLGEVNKEGTIVLQNNRVNILEAIGWAGGLGELADRANVKIIRQNGNTTEVQYINLLDENLIKSPYYYVYQNDVLIVPPMKQRPFRKYFGQNLAFAVSTLSLLLLAINLSK